ncbi:MAG: hypothetical protein J2P49_04650 [Methylocapsa sp.]|nr:hypothetical protein [Methylocapsa sp.]
MIQICHAMAGLILLAPIGALILDPALPEWMPTLTLQGLQIGDKRVSISFRRDGSGATGYNVIGGAPGSRIHQVEPSAASPGRDRFALAAAAFSGVNA